MVVMKKMLFSIFMIFLSTALLAQQKRYSINISSIPSQHKVIVLADNKPFTEFIYPDSLEKPVLYPIYASDGNIITRGFPLQSRAGEPIDHPHHIGLWMNYENVNGLDFWNNSFAIPAEKKKLYGWIKTNGIVQTKNGGEGILEYSADWINQSKDILLKETTTFYFTANDNEHIIDRVTTLTAQQDVLFKDAKDGFL